MKSYEQIFLANREWSQSKLIKDPNYFKRLSLNQSPQYLWIGCSDSRVPANEVTGTGAGELFVHRNIANQVFSTDKNFMSVLKYAVDYLKVKHIVICGHYGCGGVKAAMSDLQDEHITPWINGIKKTAECNKDTLNQIKDETTKINSMIEINVIEQVDRLYNNPIIRAAWARGHHLHIHGWIFDLETGELSTLKEVNPNELPLDIYNNQKTLVN